MLLAIFGKYVVNLILILALLDSTRVFRLARATAHECRGDGLSSKRRSCAARGWAGSSFNEILPNIMPPLVAEFGLRFCFVFLTISCAVLPRRRHPAADRRLGLDGAPRTRR